MKTPKLDIFPSKSQAKKAKNTEQVKKRKHCNEKRRCKENMRFFFIAWLFLTVQVVQRALAGESLSRGTFPSAEAGGGTSAPCTPSLLWLLTPDVTKIRATLWPRASLGKIKGITAGSWLGFPA